MLPLLLLGMLVLAYWAILEFLRAQWKAIPQPQLVNHEGPKDTCISLIVVIRNEARNLPQLFRALQEQSINTDLFELHLVDDGSTDGSWQLAEDFQRQSAFRLVLHQLQPQPVRGSPKKAAITQVISCAKGHIVAITDGDCQPARGWLSNLLSIWRQHDPVFVSGPVRYMGERNLFERLQALDFASLIGVGAAMLQAGKPGMCNAANMAFSKQAFMSVGGYGGNTHIPSGDDEFLLQKLASRYPGRITFLKAQGALVSTAACSSWQQFVQQRKRWAGKWRLHTGCRTKMMAAGIFTFYLMLAVALLLPLWRPGLGVGILFILAIKTLADYRFLQPVFHFLKKPLSLKVFLLLELVYPFYVLFFAVAANVGSFTWKERTYRYTSAAHE